MRISTPSDPVRKIAQSSALPIGPHVGAPDDVDLARKLRVRQPRLLELRQDAAARGSPVPSSGGTPGAATAVHSDVTASIHRHCPDPDADGRGQGPPGVAGRQAGPLDQDECRTIEERRQDAIRRGISGVSGITATFEGVEQGAAPEQQGRQRTRTNSGSSTSSTNLEGGYVGPDSSMQEQPRGAAATSRGAIVEQQPFDRNDEPPTPVRLPPASETKKHENDAALAQSSPSAGGDQSPTKQRTTRRARCQSLQDGWAPTGMQDDSSEVHPIASVDFEEWPDPSGRLQ